MTTLTGTRSELLRALGAMAEPPGPEHARLAGALGLPPPAGTDWTEAFTVQLVPHASVYLNGDGMLGGEAADRVGGFWRALRIPVQADPDHLTALLGLYASLVDRQASEPDEPRRALLGQGRAALLHEHLLSWLPAYTQAMVDVGPQPYAAWAALLHRALSDESARVGTPDQLPAHLREIPPVPGPDEDIAALINALLCPARSGLILARGHLAVLARDAELGLRLGDRRRMLHSLLEQNPATTLALLTDQAQIWASRHRADAPATGAIATHWAGRAAGTAALLRT
jgi:hypothetical protein